jgi:two-component system OmpR family sensor kinase
MGRTALSIRVKLTLGFALFLGALMFASGAALYGIVRYQLFHHHDPSLIETAAQVERILSRQDDCAHLETAQIEALDRLGHLILFHETEGEGQVFYRSPDSGKLPAPPSLASLKSLAPYETLHQGGETLRVHSRPYRTRSGRHGLIRVMDRMGEIDEPLRFLRLSLILLVPIAIAIAALGGYWMAGRALAPVDRITKQAQAIEAQNLASRIPHPGPDDELGRLVDTLNQMFGRLEHAFEGMKRFTSDASHELRSPLAIMRSTIDVALSHPRSREEYRASLDSLGEEVDRLRRISSDLLLLARADAGRLDLEMVPVRLDLLAREVVEAFQPVAQHKSISLRGSLDEAITVVGDERWLRQVMANLLDNALKFTPPDGEVHVDIQADAKETRVTILDTGPGIPEEHLPRIFERFFQGDPARTRDEKQGTGLGLAISAWIVEAHGGILTATNRTEVTGCRMTLDIPSLR